MSQQEIESMIQAAVKAANEKQKKIFDRKISELTNKVINLGGEHVEEFREIVINN